MVSTQKACLPQQVLQNEKGSKEQPLHSRAALIPRSKFSSPEHASAAGVVRTTGRGAATCGCGAEEGCGSSLAMARLAPMRIARAKADSVRTICLPVISTSFVLILRKLYIKR
jgi:hypothetical protein